jgi:putative dimethyl sulfoxide reductase chaperone
MMAAGVAANAAFRRSVLYWTISELFLTCPDEQFVERLRRALHPDPVSEAFDPVTLNLVGIHSALPKDAGGVEKLAVEYTRLFGAASPAYGLPPPYESVHCTADMPAEVAAAVAQFYAEAGFSPIDGALPPDHLGVELKFVALLSHAEHQAWRAGAFHDAHRILRQERRFLEEHVASWVPAYISTVKKSANHPVYKRLASLTEQLCAQKNWPRTDQQEWV